MRPFSSSLIRRARWGCLLFACMGCCMPIQAAVVPSSFGTVIGHALLCLNRMDAGYFYTYLKDAFGQPYKHDGGAYWFKTGSTLWDTPIDEIMVSDGLSGHTFIGAVANVTAEKLEAAIGTAMGIRHSPIDSTSFPMRQSPAGSTIVYFNKKSKIYCASSQYLLPLIP
jgi:hypothetical protein